MPFDPSAIAEIGKPKYDAAQAASNAYTLKNQMQQSQIGDVQLATLRRDAAEQSQIKELAGKFDLTTEEGRQKYGGEIMRINPEKGVKALRESADLSKSAIDVNNAMLDTFEKRAGIGSAAILPVYAHITDMKARGATPEQIDAEVKPLVMQSLDGLAQAKTADGKLLYTPDEIGHMKNLLNSGNVEAGVASLAMMSQKGLQQVTEMRKAATAGQKIAKTADGVFLVAPNGTMTRLGDNPPTGGAGGGAPGLDQETADQIAGQMMEGVPPRDLLAGLAAGDRVQIQKSVTKQMKDKGFSPAMMAAKRSLMRAGMKAADAAGNQAGKVAVGVAEMQTFAPLALEASAAVDRVSFVPYNKLMQMGEKAISDPKLAKFYASTQALLNAYDVVAARGGTDMDKREHNRQMLSTAQSPEAYDTVVRFLVQEATAAEKAAQTAMQPGTYNPEHKLPTDQHIPPLPPAGGAQEPQEGQTAVNPQTGEKLVMKSGQWTPAQ